MADIEIESTRKPITVNLVGVQYTLTPPKAAIAIEMAEAAKGMTTTGDDANVDETLKVLYDWLGMAMTAKDVEAVKKRLKSKTDDLDIPHLTTLLEKVMEYVVGNPTT
jgi:hypothetical protein